MLVVGSKMYIIFFPEPPNLFLSPPPPVEALDLVTNRQGAI